MLVPTATRRTKGTKKRTKKNREKLLKALGSSALVSKP